MVVFLLSLSQSVICFMFLTSMMKFVPTWMTLEMWGSCHRDRIGNMSCWVVGFDCLLLLDTLAWFIIATCFVVSVILLWYSNGVSFWVCNHSVCHLYIYMHMDSPRDCLCIYVYGQFMRLVFEFSKPRKEGKQIMHGILINQLDLHKF